MSIWKETSLLDMTILNFGIKKVGPYFDILNISKILWFPLWLPAGYNLEEYVFNEKKDFYPRVDDRLSEN